MAPTPLGRPALITVHPSSLLRMRGREAVEATARLVAGLRQIQALPAAAS